VELAKFKSATLTKKQKAKFLTEDEWDLAAELCAVLGPFHAATVTLSGHSHVNMSEVLTLWKRIINTLVVLDGSADFQLCSDLCQRLTASMKTHFDKHLDLMEFKMSAALDPNSKKLKFTDKDKREAVWTAMAQECHAVLAQERKAMGDENKEMSKKEDTKTQKPGRAKEIAHSFGSTLLEDFSESDDSGALDQDSDSSQSNIATQIRTFRESPMKEKQKTNVLNFWNHNGHLFPVLAKAARMFIGINASSAASERTFSSCGFLTAGRRNQMSRKLLEALILLNEFSKCDNLWRMLIAAV